MIKFFRLSNDKWQVLSSALSHIGQAIILFSLAALFVPEAVSLSKDFSRVFALIYLIGGLLILCIAVIIRDRGK